MIAADRRPRKSPPASSAACSALSSRWASGPAGALEPLHHRLPHLRGVGHVGQGDAGVADQVAGRVDALPPGVGGEVAVHPEDGDLPALGLRVDAAQRGEHLLGGEPAAQEVQADRAVHRLGHRLGGDDPVAGQRERHAVADGEGLGLGGHAQLPAPGVAGDDRVGHRNGLPAPAGGANTDAARPGTAVRRAPAPSPAPAARPSAAGPRWSAPGGRRSARRRRRASRKPSR